MEITNIAQLDLSKRYTYADYLQWKFEERVELFKGFIARMSAPNRKHQEVSVTLTLALGGFFAGYPCKMYTAPFDVRLPKANSKGDKKVNTVVQPDICVVCDRSKLDERGCIGAPDLVVEILSPSNSKKEMDSKYDLYEEAGVKEYWIVDPRAETVLIYVLDPEKEKFYGIKPLVVDNILHSPTFPGLEIPVEKIFAE